MSTNKSTKNKKRKKKNGNSVIIICGAIIGAMIAAGGLGYLGGRAYYSGKFLSNTTINGKDVSGMTAEKACDVLGAYNTPSALTISTIDGQTISIPVTDFDYEFNAEDEVKKLLDDVNHTAWFTGLAGNTTLSYTEAASYDKQKLEKILEYTGWGEIPTENAELVQDDNGYTIKDEVQGNVVTDMDKLISKVEDSIDMGVFEVKLNEKTGCYEVPAVDAASLSEKCEKLNKLFDMSITYDFDYTTRTLTGKTIMKLLNVDDNGDYNVDEDRVASYVEKLAEKYDTYNTERKFNATIQGNITIPTSSDAKYGWWIDKDRTTEELIEMLYDGDSVESVDPIYYEDPCGFVYTGVESARTKDDDIGDTYIEIDLSNQQLWYYKKGKLEYQTYIVSGQTTSMARTTLPGVYKLWSKATDYRMKATNADGESWDTTCNYWNNVSLCGIGLHDTVTRTAFGGSIYTYLGSHGCINMNYASAQYIYNNVDLGTPVVMYYTPQQWKSLNG